MSEFRPGANAHPDMAITPTFTMDDVKERTDAFLDVVHDLQIEALQQLGEECIKYARDDHPANWQDQTGNLRSSIGYMVFENGVAIHQSAFDQIPPKKPKKGDYVYKGGATGKELCESIGKGTKGLTLVVVAGMNYALAVESKGYNVLTGAEHFAERELPRMIAQLMSDIKRV